MGIGYTASDRYRYAMVQDMSLAENMFLKSSYLKNWVKNGIVKWKAVQKYTRDQIKTYAVKAPDDSVPMGSLSGGNQQKVIVAREVDMGHKVIIFMPAHPGLDLGVYDYVHKTILLLRKKKENPYFWYLQSFQRFLHYLIGLQLCTKERLWEFTKTVN